MVSVTIDAALSAVLLQVPYSLRHQTSASQGVGLALLCWRGLLVLKQKQVELLVLSFGKKRIGGSRSNLKPTCNERTVLPAVGPRDASLSSGTQHADHEQPRSRR